LAGTANLTRDSNERMLIETTDRGLYCAAGDFYIDPWQPVDRAVITHAHSDHARIGSARYLCAAPGLPVLRVRLGGEAPIEALAYGEPIGINGVRVSLHPAGHVLGSSALVRCASSSPSWCSSSVSRASSVPSDTSPESRCASRECCACAPTRDRLTPTP